MVSGAPDAALCGKEIGVDTRLQEGITNTPKTATHVCYQPPDPRPLPSFYRYLQALICELRSPCLA